jgi:membrane protein DedA with SNARE-associated domain
MEHALNIIADFVTKTARPFTIYAAGFAIARAIIINPDASLLWAGVAIVLGYTAGRSFEKVKNNADIS